MVTKAETKSSNGAGELPDGWNTWLGINAAAKLLDTNHSAVSRLVRDGAVKRIVGPDGVPRYSPEDLEAARGVFETPAEKAGLTHEEFKAGNELVKQVLSHHAIMVPLLSSGYQAMIGAAEGRLGAMAGELTAKNARIAELEKERDAAARDREKSLIDAHAQMLAERSFEAAERRKDRAFTAVTEKFAPLLLQKFGLGDPKMQLGSQLLSTIKRDQLLGLLAIGVLDEKQTVLVMKLLAPLTAEETQALKDAGVIKDPPAPDTKAEAGEKAPA